MIVVDADLAKALAHTGAYDRARQVVADARTAAPRQHRTVLLLGLDRVRGLAGRAGRWRSRS